MNTKNFVSELAAVRRCGRSVNESEIKYMRKYFRFSPCSQICTCVVQFYLYLSWRDQHSKNKAPGFESGRWLCVMSKVAFIFIVTNYQRFATWNITWALLESSANWFSFSAMQNCQRATCSAEVNLMELLPANRPKHSFEMRTKVAPYLLQLSDSLLPFQLKGQTLAQSI